MITDTALQKHLQTHYSIEDAGDNVSTLIVEYGGHYWVMSIGKKDYDKHNVWHGKYVKIRDREKCELIEEALFYLFETIKYGWIIPGKLK